MKKRGRPKGSKNKPKDGKKEIVDNLKEMKFQTGSGVSYKFIEKGSTEKKLVDKIQEQNFMLNVSKSKFLGYCDKCGSMLSESDLISVRIFECSSCGNRSGKNKIQTISSKYDRNEYTNKKEYLKDIIQTEQINNIEVSNGPKTGNAILDNLDHLIEEKEEDE